MRCRSTRAPFEMCDRERHRRLVAESADSLQTEDLSPKNPQATRSALQRFKPAVSKPILLFLAGFLWAAAGIGLLMTACVWLRHAAHATALLSAGAGAAIGLTVYRLGFLRIVEKNLKRLLPLQEKRCMFSFVPWKSYLIAALMIAMGAALRHSSLPRPYLAVIYSAMGLALSLSGVRYLRVFAQEVPRPTREAHEKLLDA